jgi:hypothetical protein
MCQQLFDWGVGKKQIDTWIANLDTKTINDAINQTLSRSKHKGNRSNSGGYICHVRIAIMSSIKIGLRIGM